MVIHNLNRIRLIWFSGIEWILLKKRGSDIENVKLFDGSHEQRKMWSWGKIQGNDRQKY